MHYHLLVFSDNDRIKLKTRYHALLQKLEAGKEIEKYAMEELATVLRGVLQSQQALQSFWQQAQQDPSTHYHLHLTCADKELLNLPWQLAIDAWENRNIHITKGSAAITALPEYAPKAGPLRILVMISSPEDLKHNKRLSYEEEEQIILKALSALRTTGQVQVHFTEDGSLAGLQRKLQQQHYHILYFSGHGIYKNDKGYLQLEDPVTYLSKEVKAQDLARTLKGAQVQTPPLIVLSSCQTAQGGMEEGFRGVADELIHEGVPAVIAMAFSIKDQFNIVFVGHLYEQLANKRPLPEAYTQALQDMRLQEQQQLDSANKKLYQPSQWLIPQLYVSQQVLHIVDWGAYEQAPAIHDVRFMEEEQGELFIGRRRESAALTTELINNRTVLITGQGGIGKTMLATYLVKRLVISDTAFHCFAFNATSIGLQAMVSQLLHYLEIADPAFNHIAEERQGKTIDQQLDLLIEQVSKRCKPVWLFDDLENCQQQPGDILKQEHVEWMSYLQQRIRNRYPVILINRYEIPELQDVFNVSLNQVPFVDFQRKCFQLALRNLHTKIPLPGMAKVAELLHGMFGGNYRVLEVLNELYISDAAKVEFIMQQIVKFQNIEMAKELMRDIHQKLKDLSKPLILPELLALLTYEEKKTLHLMLYFKGPVLPLALELQKAHENFMLHLQRLRSLTLIEEHTHKETGHKLYEIAPFVENSVDGISLPQVYYYPEYAGDYYFKAGDEIFFSYTDVETSLEQYKLSGSIDKLNEVGVILTNKYQRSGLHDPTLYFGELIEQMAGDKTAGDILNNIGLTYLRFGNQKKALTYFTKFFIISRVHKNNKSMSMALNAIGQTHSQWGDLDTGLDWFEKSLQLSIAGDYKEEQAVTYSNIGSLYCERGEYDAALKAYEQSLTIRKSVKNFFGVANTLNNISRVYGERGDHAKEMGLLREALAIAVEIDNKHLQAMFLNNIGYQLMAEKDYEAALVCYQKDLAISESTDDEEEIGKAMYGLGLVYKQLGKHNEAVDHITKGATILQKFDFPSIQEESLLQVGIVYIDRGDAAEAISLLNMCLTDFLDLGYGSKAGEVLYYIGDAYLRLRDIDKGIENLEDCLDMLKRSDDKEMKSKALARLKEARAMEMALQEKTTDKI